jgi:hypothetical protein
VTNRYPPGGQKTKPFVRGPFTYFKLTVDDETQGQDYPVPEVSHSSTRKTLNPETEISEAGLALERFLTELFELFALKPRRPFRVIGEQIDGSFELDHDSFASGQVGKGTGVRRGAAVFSGAARGKILNHARRVPIRQWGQPSSKARDLTGEAAAVSPWTVMTC